MNAGRVATSNGGLLVGVDIGGTKTAILIAEPDGIVVGHHLAPTAVGAPERAADAIAGLVVTALADAGAAPQDVAALGVGVPGRVDREHGEVTMAVNLDWHDLPLGPRLEARLGIPTFLENDVRAAALGLHRRRVFGEAHSLAFLAIGTGISAGVVLDGRLHRGAAGLAGEIGHVVVDPNGRRCACGMTGCFETLAAGPAIVARAMAGWAKSDDFPERRNLRPIGADAVFAAAGVGDPVAIQVIEDAGRAIAWGVHLLALAYNVEILVLGGGVSHAGEPFMAPIRRELDRYRGSSQLAKEVLVPDLVQLLPPGADAGAWGALTIAREALSAAPVAARREVGHA